MTKKIMLSYPMKGKTDEELNQMKHEMINSLFDKFGEEEVIILDTIIEDADEKSELECFAESIFHLSQADVICMGPGWKSARGCRLEHTIACDYEMPVIYLDPLIKYGEKRYDYHDFEEYCTITDTKEYSKTLNDFYNELVEDGCLEDYDGDKEIVLELAQENYNEYLSDNCMFGKQVVDRLNQYETLLKPICEICQKYKINIEDLPGVLEEYIAYDNEEYLEKLQSQKRS